MFSDFTNDLPRLQLLSGLTNISSLKDFDVDSNFGNNVDFDYYSTDQFSNNQNIGNILTELDSFSVIHNNVRSLSANFDHLINVLSVVKCKFDIIGLTETKIRFDHPTITNTAIPGYNFISQPSHTEAGGVGFYIRDDCEFHIRSDFSVSTNGFEILTVDIHRESQSNIICSVIYRHPNGNFDNFQSYFSNMINKLSNERKYTIVMGDFNINLLNYKTHPPTEEFINNISAYCFQPHILQPTRITEHTAY